MANSLDSRFAATHKVVETAVQQERENRTGGRPAGWKNGAATPVLDQEIEAAKQAMQAAGETPRGVQREPVQKADSAPVTATKAKLYYLGQNAKGEEVVVTTKEITGKNPADLMNQIKVIHLQAQKERQKIEVELLDGNTPVEEISAPAPTPVVEIPVAASVSQAALISETKPEKIDTDDFVGEIKKDGNYWVAVIQYKNGSGTERFKGKSKDALILELLKGKGNATIRVKQAVREAKLGTAPDLEYSWDRNMCSQETFDGMDATNKGLFISNLELQNAIQFVLQHPEYYDTENNKTMLMKYLADRGWPITIRNLDIAYRFLLADDVFETRPEPTPVVEETPTVPVSAPAAQKVEDSTPVVPAAPATPAVEPSQPVWRKRGTSGLKPGFSSASEETAESEHQPKEASEAELRKMDIKDLRRIAVPSIARSAQARR